MLWGDGVTGKMKRRKEEGQQGRQFRWVICRDNKKRRKKKKASIILREILLQSHNPEEDGRGSGRLYHHLGRRLDKRPHGKKTQEKKVGDMKLCTRSSQKESKRENAGAARKKLGEEVIWENLVGTGSKPGMRSSCPRRSVSRRGGGGKNSVLVDLGQQGEKLGKGKKG